jgi:hypothetical protein
VVSGLPATTCSPIDRQRASSVEPSRGLQPDGAPDGAPWAGRGGPDGPVVGVQESNPSPSASSVFSSMLRLPLGVVGRGPSDQRVGV